jgi:thiosulfate reductase cytochrome b subunit
MKIGAYPLWLRLWHWTNALLCLLLLLTGVSMHYAQPVLAGRFRTVIFVHNTSGIMLTVFYFVFLFGNVFWGNGRYYLLAPGDLSSGLLRQTRHYLLGIFVGERSPFPHTETRKFNPLQKLSYLFIMYLLFPFLVVTGWALLFPEQLPGQLFGIPGIGVPALAHTILGFFLSLFIVVHTYLGTTGDTLTELFRLMLTGKAIAHGEARLAAAQSLEKSAQGGKRSA